MARVEVDGEPVWAPERRPWGWPDALALAAWTAALVASFWPAVSMRGALFYFDITEINYPYRHFFAEELRSGRLAMWCPGLYCGLPLYSESQAGYFHPLKYLLYPWLETWQAFNLDTVLSVYLTGLGTFGWLRRHVGAAGALTGAAVFGLSGFTWAHLIHTSMANALISVPLAVWGLEATWDGGRLRGMVLGGLAMACQVFAGHLQDFLLTGLLIGLYGLYRSATERGWRRRLFAPGTAAGLVGVGVAVSAVQWVPSKELLDRSPRAGGLSWDDLTYGSWNPELLPTLLVREAYGTRARDTDWMDGFYPYHEMDTYLGVAGLALAIVGAAAYRDRWVGFWVLLAGVGGALMLGRFTFLFDPMHRVPILGSSRIPVRYHLWVALAAGALAGVGVDRLGRPGRVGLRPATLILFWMALASAVVLVYVYAPIWIGPDRWTKSYHVLRYRWLGNELALATARTAALAALGWVLAARAARASRPSRRARLAVCLPVVVLADLIGAHAFDVPTVDPSYWTTPPQTAEWLKRDGVVRVFGVAERSAGEPGYASEKVDFLAVREALDWSLPPVWGVATSRGETPIIPNRLKTYTDAAKPGAGRFDVESVTHIVTRKRDRLLGLAPPERVGRFFIHRNPTAQPRARLMGRPVYAGSEAEAAQAIARLGTALRDRVIVEDPDRPLPADATVSGIARIVRDEPERVVVETDSPGDAYLVLADTFDPGWSAAVDGRPVPVRPAFAAFRAVFVPRGRHTIVFTYRPAGFREGLMVTVVGLALTLLGLAWPRPLATLGPEHGDSGWRRGWPWWMFVAIVVLVAVSAVQVTPDGRVRVHRRWHDRLHRFTWGAGIEAMHQFRRERARE